MKSSICLHAAAAIVAVSSLSASAFAAGVHFQPQSLGANSQHDQWNSLTATTPGVPVGWNGNNPGLGIPSQTPDNAGDGDATLHKLSGGAFLASWGIYSFASNYTLAFRDVTPVAELETVVFQFEFTDNPDFGTFVNGVLPTLSYNGGSQTIAPISNDLLGVDFLDLLGVESVTRKFVYDLSSVTDAITSFEILASLNVHVGFLAAQLDQSGPSPSRAAWRWSAWGWQASRSAVAAARSNETH